ncbi:MAG: hypothetical protein JOZ19_12450 [Rubrobacter sp.]|nr:hypothetical protein [Rubrobacter sp.]
MTRSGEPCRRPRGWGTDHSGVGSCKYHPGGKVGAPKGNKNALVHGYYEYIGPEMLTDEERELAGLIIAKLMKFDPLEATQASYVMLCLRERRLLRDLARLRELGDDALVLVDRRTKKGYDHKEPVELTIERWRVLSDDVLRLEDRLNSIAHVMETVTEQLARYEHRGRDRHTFDELFAAIKRSAPMKEKDG